MDGVGIVCLDQKGHGVLQWLVLRSKKAGSDPFLKWSKLEMRDEKWGLSRYFHGWKTHWLLRKYRSSTSKNKSGQTRFKFGEIRN
jgi:hypothetical protein